MKKLLSIISIAAVMTACTSNADKIAAENARLKAYQDSVQMAADTAGLAQFQQWKAQNELGEQQTVAAVAPVQRSTATRRTYASSTRRSSGSSGSMSSTSTTAAKKEGWSKTAKGAVIGGVVGAGAGAIINKKNRAAGAVIGGVIGAGTGAVIGRQQDKKDGRVGN